MWWRILLICLAYLLISAHFLRYGQHPFAISFAVAPILLFIKQSWSSRLLQIVLVASCVLVWGVSTYDYIQVRVSMGEPWTRLSLIMSSVIVFTAIAASCCSGIIKKRANRNPYG
ncbi:hypothetical protein [Shewanella gelidii]|uniref:Uncharacterized protein n=1 Tax=Shewanella gelidii TaxID=1642821 RepID=A0A917NBK6_9GAMM|nr:hypothetical protein [Shewanella gelidii]MCL1098691.1 hypothetical protein [Shewanella gelidii]GGI86023.1 hypothetical protein GCM10009332_24190 [Shewanella gelidii]